MSIRVDERARIAQISVSGGGVPKRAVPAAQVTALGLEGDVQRNREHHGGPEPALCLFSLERIRALQAEGHQITPGSIGENLEGIDWSAVVAGAYLGLGREVVIQVTRHTAPCASITASFCDRDYARVSQNRPPGDSRVYARVLRERPLTSADPARMLSRAEAAAMGAR